MKKTAATKKAGTSDIFEQARKVFSGSYVDMLRAKGHDLLEQEGNGSFLIDSDGNRYLDCCTSGGSYNLGRRNEVIAGRFMKAVYETDQGNFVMPSDYKALLARRISAFVPGRLDCVLFGVTRGESMEAACKLARGFTARPGFVTVDGGRYGESGFALSLSDREGKEQFGGLIPGVSTVPFGDVEAARKAITPNTAAFILEPVQAENHCRTADAAYFRQLRVLCDAAGAKLVFDETQSGFGRTGTRFFFEASGVEPDILIFGEAVTSGMFPMTAMVFTPELKRFFDIHPLIHLCTFGGHDLGCLVAMAALDEYERLEPWKNAALQGDVLMRGLTACAARHAQTLVSVAGRGLLRSLKFASEELARAFCRGARHNRLLVDTGKVDRTAVLIRPSLLVTDDEAAAIIDGVTKTLASL
ncbi:MAG TPA: aspartate aminotransferase family protein [Deltaproteobacteria bacterium]|nr:aspartate aminotransferase family protein [Deltaproteobacteria bacterium]